MKKEILLRAAFRSATRMRSPHAVVQIELTNE
jgi:hypothetical protein